MTRDAVGVEKKESLCTTGGNVTSATTMETSMEVPPEIKHRIPLRPRNPYVHFYVKVNSAHFFLVFKDECLLEK